tara:strand:+ start:9593 stop:10465 length:873 start_codon:yes stop_codon:yes gene_type:complete
LKFLVTGSSGLVGQQVSKDLSMSYEVVSCYNKAEPEYGEPVKMDLQNPDEISNVLTQTNPDVILHLGGMTDVELCEKEKTSAFKINSEATEIIAKESANLGSFLVYVSTDYVFDGNAGMYNENDEPNPLGFYAKSKLDGEKHVQKYSPKYCIARISTPFGIHQRKKSFPVWVIENLKQKKQINVLTDQITSPTYVPNLSKMLIEISNKKIDGILHVSGATNVSRFDMARMIADKLEYDQSLLNPITIDDMNWNAKRPRNSSLDTSKANSILEESPQKLDQSIELFINSMN